MSLLATIATAINVPIENFSQQGEATLKDDGVLSTRSEQEDLFALYLSLNQPNRIIALTMIRYLAKKLPEF